jgi:hypothetical protein
VAISDQPAYGACITEVKLSIALLDQSPGSDWYLFGAPGVRKRTAAILIPRSCARTEYDPNWDMESRLGFTARLEVSPMPAHKSKPLIAYRRRVKRRGAVRVEVHVSKNDAPLIRGVARALNDPAREATARALLRERFGFAQRPQSAAGGRASGGHRSKPRSRFLAGVPRCELPDRHQHHL